MASCLTLLFLIFVALAYWLVVTTEATYLGTHAVVKLYDWTARRYNAIKKFGFVDEARFVGLPLAGMLQDTPGARILDVATGTGRALLAVAAAGDLDAILVGVDHSMGMLREAQRDLGGGRAHYDAAHRDGAHFIQGDAHQLVFADATFDAVSCLEALEFMRDPRQAVREMLRVLKPGGVLLLSNRVGLEAWFLPGRQCGRGRLEALLAKEGLSEINSHRWQVDYDLIWAIKPDDR